MSRRQAALVRTGVFLAVALALLGGFRLWQSQSELTGEAASAAIVGRSLPRTAVVTALMGSEPYPLSDELIGVTVVNFFASWCWPCRAENPVLLELQAEGVRVIGVAVRDDPNNTQAFLDELGDPYFRVLADRSGATLTTLELGGELPQTLVVAADGEVLFHHSGPLAGTDGEAALEQIRDLAGPR